MSDEQGKRGRPGWPFKTRELMRQRSRQREALRLLEDDVVRRAAEGMGAPIDVDEDDRDLIEWDLRKSADEIREGPLAPVISELSIVPRAEIMSEFYQATYLGRRGKAEALGLNAGQAARETVKRLEDTPVSDDDAVGVFDYVLLLVFADEVADDGYRDPRLPPA
jgi:hypothetical protein